MPVKQITRGDIARSKFVSQKMLGGSDVMRGFHHFSEAWYSKVDGVQDKHYVDEVVFGLYHKEGGVTGEMAVRWIDLGKIVSPQLQAFDDSWEALNSFADVLEAMAKVNGKDIPPKQFCELLLRNGFKDLTARERSKLT